MLARVFPSVALSCLLLTLVCLSCAMHTVSQVEHDFKKPAFISFLPEVGQDAMLVTSFDILCSHCNVILVNTSNMQSTTLAALDWPNAVTFCPASVCSKPSLLVRMNSIVTRACLLLRARRCLTVIRSDSASLLPDTTTEVIKPFCSQMFPMCPRRSSHACVEGVAIVALDGSGHKVGAADESQHVGDSHA